MNDLLTQIIVYSFAKSNRFYRELVPGPPCAKLRMERLFDRSKFGDYVSWELYHLETTLKLSQNFSKKRIFPSSFLNYGIFDELCEKMRFKVNYAKSQHRKISKALTRSHHPWWTASYTKGNRCTDSQSPGWDDQEAHKNKVSNPKAIGQHLQEAVKTVNKCGVTFHV